MISISAPAPGDHNSRPRFPSAEHWLEHYYDCVAGGHRPWPPLSYDEIQLADAEGIFELHQEWIPCAAQLRHWGLPSHFGRTVHGYSEQFKDRLLTTLLDDVDLRTALRSLLLDGGE